MPVARDRLGDERYAPLKIRDNQGAVPGRLVFPGPQLIFTVPGPARPQSAVYQGDRVPGGLGCILFCWPVPVSYTHLRAHETKANLVCRLLLEKKKTTNSQTQ